VEELAVYLFCSLFEGDLPLQHYECWMLLQMPAVPFCSHQYPHSQLSIAENKLYEFCKAYETLYGKEKCTPNMHNMHMHLGQSVQNMDL